MLPDDPWEFETTIDFHDFGRMGYTVVYLPRHLENELPFDKYPRLRVDAEILDYPIDGAFQPGQGRYYLILSKRFLKEAGLALGDRVDVRFRVADQNAVDVPDELRRALRTNAQAATAWEALTPGKQRALAHRVNSARTAPTTAKRIEEVLTALLA